MTWCSQFARVLELPNNTNREYDAGLLHGLVILKHSTLLARRPHSRSNWLKVRETCMAIGKGKAAEGLCRYWRIDEFDKDSLKHIPCNVLAG
jgi:hypothetical protein